MAETEDQLSPRPGVRTLTLFDLSGIQAYLFESNRLAESLGASELVRAALEDWLPECTDGVGKTPSWDAWRMNPGRLEMEESDVIDVELIFVGGGNAAVLFRTADTARRVTQAWSERLLLDAPGLRGVVSHVPSPAGTLASAFKDAQVDLAAFKPAYRARGLPLRWPVSRACSSTGLAANVEAREPGNETAFLSRSADTKRRARYVALQQLSGRFREVEESGYAFTDQIDRLGGRKGESHVAVVHIDGNGMGRRLEQATIAALEVGETDAAFADRLRSISLAATRAVRGAMTATVERLLAALSQLQNLGLTPFIEPAPRPAPLLPLRPIIEGGDDVTFVCDGRIGLSLAAAFLEAFSDRDDGAGGKMSACAGIAIVPAHFPFRRGYELAEGLVRNAKAAAQEHRQNYGVLESSWLDFDLSFGGALIRAHA